jgi:hypothetical protein
MCKGVNTILFFKVDVEKQVLVKISGEQTYTNKMGHG